MDVTTFMECAQSQIKEATDRIKLGLLLHSLELPAEARIGYYDCSSYENTAYITVNVSYLSGGYGPEYRERVNALAWADRVRPIGQIMRAFHAHKIDRTVSTYDASVTYNAEGSLGNMSVTLYVRVDTGGLSPLCKIETIETTELVTRKKVVVTCPEPVGAHGE